MTGARPDRALLAAVDAGLLTGDDAAAAVAAPGSAAVLAALTATRADLAATGRPDMPDAVRTRLRAALASVEAPVGAAGGRSAPADAGERGGSVVPDDPRLVAVRVDEPVAPYERPTGRGSPPSASDPAEPPRAHRPPVEPPGRPRPEAVDARDVDRGNDSTRGPKPDHRPGSVDAGDAGPRPTSPAAPATSVVRATGSPAPRSAQAADAGSLATRSGPRRGGPRLRRGHPRGSGLGGGSRRAGPADRAARARRRTRGALASLAAAAVVAVAASFGSLPADDAPPVRTLALRLDDLATVGGSALGAAVPGGLADPARRAGCLRVAGVSEPTHPLLGAREVLLDGVPGVLLVLPSGALGSFRLLVVDAECGPGGGRVLAERTVVAEPLSPPP